MNTKQADVGVIVGRFQVPYLTEAHRLLLEGVIERHTTIIVFLGISVAKATVNNTLSFIARKDMLLEAYPTLTILPIHDVSDNEKWSDALDAAIEGVRGPKQSVMLYGGRDSFIKAYTGIHTTTEMEQTSFISGTKLREIASNTSAISEDWRAGAIWAMNNQYLKPTLTVDVAIYNLAKTCILMGRKENEELYRFIGGFVDNGELLEEAAIREVKEETGLEVKDIAYRGSYVINDWRYRGEVEKITTILFATIHLGGKPTPSDDIYELRWFKIEDLLPEIVIANHHQLLKRLTS